MRIRKLTSSDLSGQSNSSYKVVLVTCLKILWILKVKKIQMD